jgi:phytoene dehydrogenase-like protein
MASVQTIIIGGGMAGLACAAHLERAQHDWLLFEAAERPGGRVRTDVIDGYHLDRGFQVFLTAYPEARALFDYEALQLSAFKPGARVRVGKHWSRVGDPLRRPSDLFATLFSRVGSLTDKLRVLGWKRRTAAASLDELLASPETSAAEALKRMGFSERMIESFWRPFFGGIFLESELRTSSRMLHFVFKMFGEGVAALPTGGIGRMPEVLAQSLPLNRLRLNTPVGRIANGAVELEQGGRVSADRIVLATDGAAAHALLPDLPAPSFHRVTCDHFAFSDPVPYADWLHLNGNHRRLVNNIAFPTALHPTLAPQGRHLASVTSLTDAPLSQVCADLRTLFGKRTDRWKHLRRDQIQRALPARPNLDPPHLPLEVKPGLFIIGDHRGLPSLNSALATGRLTAESIVHGGQSKLQF